MTKYGFYVNLSACSGCKACQLACKDKNDLTDDRMWRRILDIEGGEWVARGASWVNNTFNYFISTSCQHCEEPICMDVCPTQAISQREDGIVLIDYDKCVGCRYCEWACPYGAPQFDESAGIMTKCNFCYDYIDAGQQPACVSACQMRVLDFGDIDELREKYGDIDNIHPLPDPSITQPHIVFTPHKDSQLASTDSAHIGNEEEV